MNSRRIRMPITHNTPKARVGVVEQCLGLNQVVEGGVGGIANDFFFAQPKNAAARTSQNAKPTQNDPHKLRRLRRPTGPRRAAMRAL